MAGFRNIDYSKMLYETLRNYFSVNAAGEMSILYRFMSAIVAPFQAPFDDYQVFRTKEALIASCKWQIGQLTNVLNYLYDATLKRIFISQATITIIADPMFQYSPVHFDSDFGNPPAQFEHEFGDRAAGTAVVINVPAGVNQSDLVATIEQIRMEGIPYTISTF